MKYAILPAACIALASLAGNAHAETSVQGQVQLKASVNRVCSGSVSGAIELEGFLSTTNGTLEPEMGGTLQFGNVTCNYPAYVSVKTTLGALKVGSADCNLVAALANCIKYKAVVSWAENAPEVFADATPEAAGRISVSGPTNGPSTGDAMLQVTLEGPFGKQFVGGEYTDTLVVKIGQTL